MLHNKFFMSLSLKLSLAACLALQHLVSLSFESEESNNTTQISDRSIKYPATLIKIVPMIIYAERGGFNPVVISIICGSLVFTVIAVAMIITMICFKGKVFRHRNASLENQPTREQSLPLMAQTQTSHQNGYVHEDPQSVLSSETANHWLDEKVLTAPYNNAVFEIEPSRLTFGEQLGKGRFHIVRKAELTFPDSDERPMTVAVKSIRDSRETEQFRTLSTEIKLLATLGQHPNIVGMIGAATSKLQKGYLYLVVQYCPGGDFRDFLIRHRQKFINSEDVVFEKPRVTRQTSASGYERPSTMESAVEDANRRSPQLKLLDLKVFSHQIASGMKFLHERRCLHRELSAKNIVVSPGNILKIGGLALAKDVYKYANNEYKIKNTDRKVPYKWLAPECFRNHIYNKETDIWSFGVVLWEVFTMGDRPYSQVKRLDDKFLELIIKTRYRLPKPRYADEDFYKLMLRCWDEIPSSRPQFEALEALLFNRIAVKSLSHPEIAGSRPPERKTAHSNNDDSNADPSEPPPVPPRPKNSCLSSVSPSSATFLFPLPDS